MIPNNSGAGAAPLLPGAPVNKIAVIGAGSAGRGFAIACASAGFDVILEDVMPANLRRAQEQLAERPANEVRGSLQFALTIEAAVREADLVVDFVPDELESKLEIFCLVDRMAPPRTVVLTPSEALSITDLASCTYRGERCFAVRGGFLKPSPESSVTLLHPPSANQSSLDSTADFLRKLGYPVTVETDTEMPVLTKNLR